MNILRVWAWRVSAYCHCFCVVVICGTGLAGDLNRDFAGWFKDEKITVEIVSSPGGGFHGTITLGQEKFPVKARPEGSELKGSFTSQGEEFPFTAQTEGKDLRLVTGGTKYTLKRQAGGVNPLSATASQRGNPLATASAKSPDFAEPAATATSEASLRLVFINGKAISDKDVKAWEQNYRMRIKDGKYWYDPKTGAWGEMGGPCAGFVMPNLDVGAPLAANASKGDTSVFINGRELHRLDVLRLKQVTLVWPGRYWMDANASFGYEGGPMIGNVWLSAAQRAWGAGGGGGGGGGGRREGILSTYDKTGIAVFGY